MTCTEVRPLIDLFLAEELLVETNHDVLAHVAGCRACRASLEERRRLRAAVRSAWERAAEIAPRPEFLASLAATLSSGASARHRPTPWWRRWPGLAAAAALVAALAITGQIGLGALRLSALVHAAAGDHRDCAVSFRLHEKPISLEEAAQRFDAAFASLASLDLPANGPRGPIRILERHACVFDGRRFAHLVLRYDGRLVSLLVADGHRPSGSVTRQVNDLSVAAVSTPRHAVLVVAAMGEQDTRDLSGVVVPPVARALGGE